MSGRKEEHLREAKAFYDLTVGSALDLRLRLLLSHLYVESFLERYIKSKLKRTDGLFGENGLSFEKKVRLAHAFGELKQQFIDSLLKFNRLRNNLVHKFGHQPTLKEIEGFGRTFGKDFTAIKKEAKSPEEVLRVCCSHLCGYIAGFVGGLERNATGPS